MAQPQQERNTVNQNQQPQNQAGKTGDFGSKKDMGQGSNKTDQNQSWKNNDSKVGQKPGQDSSRSSSLPNKSTDREDEDSGIGQN